MNIAPKNKVLRFLLIAGGLYVLWLLLYFQLISTKTNWDFLLNTNLASISQEIFSWIGIESYIETESDHVLLIIDYDNFIAVKIGDACNGFKLFSVFSIFIVAFPGSTKNKLWFIPLGLILIHLANVIRVMLLLWIISYYPDTLDFNHNYTFTIFVYGIILLLWWWWAKKYSGNVEKN